MHLSMLSPRMGGGGGYPWEIDIQDSLLGRDFEHTRCPNYLTFQRKIYSKVPTFDIY